MARTVSIGNQNFEKIITNGYFYIDKTDFIRQWWEAADDVTLITRPRRFGKTLNMSMLEKFFSVEYAGRKDLFEGLSIWQNKEYRDLQGTYPVIFLSFANVKETTYINAKRKICQTIRKLYNQYDFLLNSDKINDHEKEFCQKISDNMEDYVATDSLNALLSYLMKYYGKRVIILLDEYDTPMQEAYVNGYWDELVAFTRSLFNSTFKTNPFLERAIMTGITRISIASSEALESIFSDLNNLKVITTTSEKYADCFGFTEEEVFTALKEFGLSGYKQRVKDWYDGFTFGKRNDIYNPWSIINFLDKQKVGAYWANSSSNSLVGKLIREGTPDIKQTFEMLLNGEILHAEIDEQIIYNQLSSKKNAIWSLLLTSGYLKVTNTTFVESAGRTYYDLVLTNKEVHIMFEIMIQDWFSGNDSYNYFIKALLLGDLKAMNTYMNKISEEMFSSFDSGTRPSAKEPERFYHGFVLGLMVELAEQYTIISNRESGFGRYDIMLEPKATVNEGARNYNAIIIEFKVQDSNEKELSDTVKEALRQIAEKDYQANLIAKGIPAERIRKYGFAFCGKKVLIGT